MEKGVERGTWRWRIILSAIVVVVTVGTYFYARSMLLSSEQEHLLPFLYIGIPVAFLVGVLIVIFEERLISIPKIKLATTFLSKPAVAFFKKTEYVWIILLLGMAVALTILNKYGYFG